MSDSITAQTILKHNKRGPRYTSYPTVPEWKDAISQEHLKTVYRNPNTPKALYIHIPFCQSLCWYCGCNTIIKKQKSHADTYLDYLFKEIDQIHVLAGQKLNITQLHWGGGTPNFLTEKQTIRLLDKLDEAFEIDYNGELAIEVDPRTTTEEQIYLLRKLGFNRISMGIQDFSPDVQKAINRIQSFEDVKKLYDFCRYMDFDSINFDLIYGLPKQTVEKYKDTIRKTIELKPDRIALYSYAWLPQFKSHMKLIKENDLPKAEEKLNIFLEAEKLFKDNDYDEIAMDHFALKSDELSKAAKSNKLFRNFMGYTTQTTQETVGLGLSSISYLENTFFQNHASLKDYYQSIEINTIPASKMKVLSEDDIIRNWTIQSLMCNQLLNKNDFYQKFRYNFDEYFENELPSLKEYIDEEFVLHNATDISVTEKGRYFLRNICMTFDGYLGKSQNTFSQTV